ncbi:hypothetical protein CARUB_v10024924mg [Capsella rubella]|uniref:Uncharacterized protein n=1 Tax=Capsella rubella TaxID=81985 RepID=R0FUT0_9BRAS|nr:uncharacterized protein LOC17889205 [Capsella rubella]EOA26311.1 hypothetical protein CARUB_v10024924mg [Capsella rubella]
MTRRAGLLNWGTAEEDEEKQEMNERKSDGDEGSEEDGEDDLFEINLEAVHALTSSPSYDWKRFPVRTGSVLLANCLLPAADISSAVPATSKAWNDLVWLRGILYVEKLGLDTKDA